MAECASYISIINSSENVGDSLIKINNNFFNLKRELESVKKKVEGTVQVRTFFYYGPNSSSDPTSGMQDNTSSRPSNTTIENFVNDVSQLNVPAISKLRDQVYVIYQKTGYLANNITREINNSIDVNVNGSLRNVPYQTTTPEVYNTFSPLFIIWQLIYDGNKYNVSTGFPKYSQAETISSEYWNQPLEWMEY